MLAQTDICWLSWLQPSPMGCCHPKGKHVPFFCETTGHDALQASVTHKAHIPLSRVHLLGFACQFIAFQTAASQALQFKTMHNLGHRQAVLFRASSGCCFLFHPLGSAMQTRVKSQSISMTKSVSDCQAYTPYSNCA